MNESEAATVEEQVDSSVSIRDDRPKPNGDKGLEAVVNVPAANPTANRPEDVPANTANFPAQNLRGSERIKLSGQASVALPNAFPQIGRMIEANIQGASILLDLAIVPGKVYNLHIKCYNKGRLFEGQLQGLCMHCTLSGRGFKVGFRFGPMPESVSNDLRKVLSV